MAKGKGFSLPNIEEIFKAFGGQLQEGLVKELNKAVSVAMIPLTASVELFRSATGGVINMIQGFVAKANPMAAFQFNRALDDMAATLGQILTPVLQAVTIFIREWADVMQGMRPAFKPFMDGIAELIVSLSHLIEPIITLLIPTLEMVSNYIKYAVVPAVNLFVDTLKYLVDFLKNAAKEFSGGLISFDAKKTDSTGAAIRPASYSSIEDIGKRTTLAALNMGRGGLTPDGKAVTDEQKKTNAILKDIAKGLLAIVPGNEPLKWLARQIFD